MILMIILITKSIIDIFEDITIRRTAFAFAAFADVRERREVIFFIHFGYA